MELTLFLLPQFFSLSVGILYCTLSMDQISIVPSTPRKKTHLTRDQRRDIQLLRELGWSYPKIASFIDATERQVQYACTNPATPRKRSGRPQLLTQEQTETLIEFVTSSREGRRMSYQKLASSLGFNCGVYTIQGTLERHGFHCRIAMRKPRISEKNRKIRLQWAQEHVNWTREQWDKVLWTNET